MSNNSYINRYLCDRRAFDHAFGLGDFSLAREKALDLEACALGMGDEALAAKAKELGALAAGNVAGKIFEKTSGEKSKQPAAAFLAQFSETLLNVYGDRSNWPVEVKQSLAKLSAARGSSAFATEAAKIINALRLSPETYPAFEIGEALLANHGGEFFAAAKSLEALAANGFVGDKTLSFAYDFIFGNPENTLLPLYAAGRLGKLVEGLTAIGAETLGLTKVATQAFRVTTGLATEAPVFVGAGKLVALGKGKNIDLNAGTFFKESFSSGLVFGALKFAGFFAQTVNAFLPATEVGKAAAFWNANLTSVAALMGVGGAERLVAGEHAENKPLFDAFIEACVVHFGLSAMMRSVASSDLTHKLPLQNVEAMRALYAEFGQKKLFEKALANITFIDGEKFNESIKVLRSKVVEFLNGDPYCLLVTGRHKSEEFILEALKLPYQPERIYDASSEDDVIVPARLKILVVDDAAYSGGNISSGIRGLFADLPNPERMFIGLLGATKHAINSIAYHFGRHNIFSVFEIASLNEIFSPEEIGAMYRIAAKIDGDIIPSGQDDVLTFFPHKIPDNFFSGFIRSETSNGLYLLDDTPDGLYPPYRIGHPEPKHIPDLTITNFPLIVGEQQGSLTPRFYDLGASGQFWSVIVDVLRKKIGKPYNFSPIVQVISGDDFDFISRGASQRGRALVRFLQDIYSGEWRVVREGIVPSMVVERAIQAQGFVELVGKIPPSSIAITYGPDLFLRDGVVIEDNIGDVGGRRDIFKFHGLLRKLWPDLGLVNENALEQRYFDGLKEVLPTGDNGVVAYWEDPAFSEFHDFVSNLELMRECGVFFVGSGKEGENRFEVVNGDALYVITPEGERFRVGHLNYSEFDFSIDPSYPPFFQRMKRFGYKKISEGIPGIVSLVESGRVLLGHSLGSSLADSKLIYPFVEGFIRFYLGEEPVFRSTQVFSLVDNYGLDKIDIDTALKKKNELVLKPVDGEGGVGIVVGRFVDDEAWGFSIQQALLNPENYLLFEYTEPVHLGKRIVSHRPIVEVMPDLKTNVYPGIYARAKAESSDGVIGFGVRDTESMIVVVDESSPAAVKNVIAPDGPVLSSLDENCVIDELVKLSLEANTIDLPLLKQKLGEVFRLLTSDSDSVVHYALKAYGELMMRLETDSAEVYEEAAKLRKVILEGRPSVSQSAAVLYGHIVDMFAFNETEVSAGLDVMLGWSFNSGNSLRYANARAYGRLIDLVPPESDLFNNQCLKFVGCIRSYADDVTATIINIAFKSIVEKFNRGDGRAYALADSLLEIAETGEPPMRNNAIVALSLLFDAFEPSSNFVYSMAARIRVLTGSSDVSLAQSAVAAYFKLSESFSPQSQSFVSELHDLREMIKRCEPELQLQILDIYYSLTPHFVDITSENLREEFAGLMELFVSSNDVKFRHAIIKILLKSFHVFKGAGLWHNVLNSEWLGRMGLSERLSNEVKRFFKNRYIFSSTDCWKHFLIYLSDISENGVRLLEILLPSKAKPRKIIRAIGRLNGVSYELKQDLIRAILDNSGEWIRQSRAIDKAKSFAIRIVDYVAERMLAQLLHRIPGAEKYPFLNPENNFSSSGDRERVASVRIVLHRKGVLGAMATVSGMLSSKGLNSLALMVERLGQAEVVDGRVIDRTRYVEMYDKLGFDKAFVLKWSAEYKAVLSTGRLSDAEIIGIAGKNFIIDFNSMPLVFDGKPSRYDFVIEAVKSLVDNIRNGNAGVESVEELLNIFEVNYQGIRNRLGYDFADLRIRLRNLRSALAGKLRLAEGEVRLEVSGSVDAMANISSAPVETCQYFTAVKNDSIADADPINRILHGQFKVANLFVGNTIVARRVLEITRDAKGEVHLLVDVLVTANTHVIDVAAFNKAIVDYAVSIGVQAKNVDFSHEPQKDIYPLETSDKIVRDSRKITVQPKDVPPQSTEGISKP